MRITVAVSGWEQVCCGAPFAVGRSVTWKLVAVDPATILPHAPASFAEEHHGETPEDVPHWSVTGTVREILGVSYPQVPVPGETRSFRVDPERPRCTPLTGVGSTHADPPPPEPPALPGSQPPGDFDVYWVSLDVADATELPAFVPSAAAAEQRALDAQLRDRDEARRSDPVGRILEQTADRAEAEFDDVATIHRDANRSAITIEPHRPGATAVRWARSTHESDGIGLHTGAGSWWLSASREDAALAREFLDAAAAGRVLEEVVAVVEGGGERRLDTRVQSADGRSWTVSERFAPMGSGPVVLARADLIERVQRGDVRYLPWSDPEQNASATQSAPPRADP